MQSPIKVAEQLIRWHLSKCDSCMLRVYELANKIVLHGVDPNDNDTIKTHCDTCKECKKLREINAEIILKHTLRTMLLEIYQSFKLKLRLPKNAY